MARRTRDSRGRWPGSSCPPPFGLADLRVQPGSGKLQMQRTGMSAYSFRSVWAADERYTTRSVSRRRAAWRRARATPWGLALCLAGWGGQAVVAPAARAQSAADEP